MHIGVVVVVKGETHGRALHRQVENGLELREVDPCHRFTGIELTRVRTHFVHGEVGDPGGPISKHRCLPGSHRPLNAEYLQHWLTRYRVAEKRVL